VLIRIAMKRAESFVLVLKEDARDDVSPEIPLLLHCLELMAQDVASE